MYCTTVGDAPEVMEGLPAVAADFDKDAVLRCKIAGEPQPTIKW